MKNIIVLFLVITNHAISQVNSSKDTISFTYYESVYQKIAKDSINVLYDRQKKYYIENNYSIKKDDFEKAISLKYDFKNLSYLVLPQYRLYDDAQRKYSCKSNIENFIVFNESVRYLKALTKLDEVVLSKTEIPNFIFEYQRIYNPNSFTISLRKDYFEYYLNKFSISNMDNYKILTERNENFFFELYGLPNVIFEIDSKSGLLYANYFDLFTDVLVTPRMLANDLIRKYIGENVIIELAKGNYIDVTGATIDFLPCDEPDFKSKQVFLKVIRK